MYHIARIIWWYDPKRLIHACHLQINVMLLETNWFFFAKRLLCNAMTFACYAKRWKQTQLPVRKSSSYFDLKIKKKLSLPLICNNQHFSKKKRSKNNEYILKTFIYNAWYFPDSFLKVIIIVIFLMNANKIWKEIGKMSPNDLY